MTENIRTITLAEQRRGPDFVADIAARASLTGQKVELEQPVSAGQEKLRQWQESAAHTIEAGDNRAFLRNLSSISKGQCVVVDAPVVAPDEKIS